MGDLLPRVILLPAAFKCYLVHLVLDNLSQDPCLTDPLRSHHFLACPINTAHKLLWLPHVYRVWAANICSVSRTASLVYFYCIYLKTSVSRTVQVHPLLRNPLWPSQWHKQILPVIPHHLKIPTQWSSVGLLTSPWNNGQIPVFMPSITLHSHGLLRRLRTPKVWAIRGSCSSRSGQ